MNAISERGFLTLQEFDGVYSKIKIPPSSRVSPTAVPPLHTLREPTASAPRGATLSTRIDKYRPLIMPLVHGRKKSTLARSLVQSITLGVRYGRRLATPIPSSKCHIPSISTLRISFRFGCGVKPHPQLLIINY